MRLHTLPGACSMMQYSFSVAMMRVTCIAADQGPPEWYAQIIETEFQTIL
jgi:hypothetical protein